MSIEVKMPALSPTMELGNLTKWFVKENDKVSAGDVIAEIETDKALMEVESMDDGVIGKIIIPEKTENIKVGEVIALLLEDGETINDIKDYKPTSSVSKSSSEKSDSAAKESKVSVPKEDDSKKDSMDLGVKKCITPVAKRIISDKNINSDDILGTGPKGRVVKKDVLDYVSSNSKQLNVADLRSLNSVTVPMSSMRKAISNKLQESKSSIPHFYLNISVNVDKIVDYRSEINSNHSFALKDNNIKLTLNDFIVKAVGTAMHHYPKMNCCWSKDGIVSYTRSDICIAVSAGDALYAPVIKDVYSMGVHEISKKVKELILKAKDGRLTIDELTGGSISISNLGMFGIESFYAIVNPPQASILSVGGLSQKLVLDESGSVKMSNFINLGLSVDHRIVDGVDAAKFLKMISDILENPLALML